MELLRAVDSSALNHRHFDTIMRSCVTAKRNDLLEIVEQIMAKVGLAMQASTYTSLLRGHYFARNVEAIDRTARAAAEAGIELPPHALSPIFYSACAQGDLSKALKVLENYIERELKRPPAAPLVAAPSLTSPGQASSGSKNHAGSSGDDDASTAPNTSAGASFLASSSGGAAPSKRGSDPALRSGPFGDLEVIILNELFLVMIMRGVIDRDPVKACLILEKIAQLWGKVGGQPPLDLMNTLVVAQARACLFRVPQTARDILTSLADCAESGHTLSLLVLNFTLSRVAILKDRDSAQIMLRYFTEQNSATRRHCRSFDPPLDCSHLPEGAPPLRRANRPKDSFVNSMADTIRKASKMNRTEDDS